MSTSTKVLRLPQAIAFPVLALVLFGYFFAASAPSPAFVYLQHAWHFSSAMLTVAFGVYALALLLTLILAGSLSDFIGRRPVIFFALVLQTVAMVMFMMADSIESVIWARVIQGLATGIASGALAAAVVEAAPEGQKKLGALISSVSPLAGLAVGALVSGVALKEIPHPIDLVFGSLAGLFSLGAILLIFTPESVTRRPGALASIMPRFSIPNSARTEFWRGAPVLITTWSMGGLYLALAPSLIIHAFNMENGIVNGLSITTLSGVGAIAPSLLKRFESPKVAMIGMGSIIIGILLILISLQTSSLGLFFFATALCGIGFGGAFSAIIQTLAPIVGKHERAELFAAIFIVCYLALSVPAMLAGELVKPFGLLLTVKGYVVLILVTAITGMLLQWKSLKNLRNISQSSS